MIHEVIEIDIDYSKLGINHNGNKATITTYIKDMFPDYQNKFYRPFVIICPGGGYEHHSPREAEAIAIKMLDMGYNAAILRYSLMPNIFPCQLYEAAYAVDYIRKHATQWDINPGRIIMAGFSAGGHVAGCLGTLYNNPIMDDFLKLMQLNNDDIKPNGLMLGYPVITSGDKAHLLSFERLLQDKVTDKDILKLVSVECNVTPDAPPAFIWHTFTDNSVPVENSLMLASAYKKANVNFELHIFPSGAHGLGLGTKETDTKDCKHYCPEVSVWTSLFNTWLNNLAFI